MLFATACEAKPEDAYMNFARYIEMETAYFEETEVKDLSENAEWIVLAQIDEISPLESCEFSYPIERTGQSEENWIAELVYVNTTVKCSVKGSCPKKKLCIPVVVRYFSKDNELELRTPYYEIWNDDSIDTESGMLLLFGCTESELTGCTDMVYVVDEHGGYFYSNSFMVYLGEINY